MAAFCNPWNLEMPPFPFPPIWRITKVVSKLGKLILRQQREWRGEEHRSQWLVRKSPFTAHRISWETIWTAISSESRDDLKDAPNNRVWLPRWVSIKLIKEPRNTIKWFQEDEWTWPPKEAMKRDGATSFSLFFFFGRTLHSTCKCCPQRWASLIN